MNTGADTEPVKPFPATPAAARVLAAVALGASLLQTLSGPLAAWNVQGQWPRVGVLSSAAFLAILAAGLGVQSLAIVVARRGPMAGLVVAFGVDAPP